MTSDNRTNVYDQGADSALLQTQENLRKCAEEVSRQRNLEDAARKEQIQQEVKEALHTDIPFTKQS